MTAARTASKIGIPAVAIAGVAYAFIAGFEGISFKPYKDSVGVDTVCVGNTKNIVTGRQYTEAECKLLFEGDFAESYEAVARYVNVPLTANEAVAYSSFVFNLGAGAFAQSTALKKLNAGDHEGACEQILRWRYIGKPAKDCSLAANKCMGIWKRRQAERNLCLKDLPK